MYVCIPFGCIPGVGSTEATERLQQENNRLELPVHDLQSPTEVDYQYINPRG
jgi:hypothetical protein